MRNLLVLLCSLALCCNGMTGTMAAAPSAPVWDPDDTAPMMNDVASAAAHARAAHCRTWSRKAIVVIHKLVDIARFEDGDANGLASLGNRPQIAVRRLDRLLLRHPDLYQPVCATGAKLISRFQLATDVYEMIVPVQRLVNGVEMDLHDHGHCAQDFLAALPKQPANDQARLNAQNLCAKATKITIGRRRRVTF